MSELQRERETDWQGVTNLKKKSSNNRGVKEEQVYRIEGLTCTNCAQKFEDNLRKLKGITAAQVNFGASKLKVVGEVELDQLEQAGAFDGIKLYPEGQLLEKKKPSFWLQGKTLKTTISLILVICAFWMSYTLGDTHLATLTLFISSMIIGGYTLFIKGLSNLSKLQFDMSTLMTIAILGAAAIGEWKEGAIVVLLFAISEALESYSMDQARQSIRFLMEVAPNEALIKRNNLEMMLPVEQIAIGDIMIIKPGQKIAMDGLVIKGVSSVNQAAITGESLPVLKKEGEEVFAGTLNEEGLLEVKVTKKVGDTTISKIIHLVEEAQAEKAPAQAFVDRFAKYYTPAIMLVALAVAVIPPAFLGAEWLTWIYQGLAVLVVGCPCALVISTPIAIVTAIGNAARNGVLIKGGVYLEELGRIQAIAFDKTGTLTEGQPEVTDIISLESTDLNPLFLAAALEKGSMHPLATAFLRSAEKEGIDWSYWEVEDFASHTGKGVSAKVNDQLFYLGNRSFLEEKTKSTLEVSVDKQMMELKEQGKTVILLGTKEKIMAMFAIADQIRFSSKQLMKELHSIGIKQTVMLTGDDQITAKAIAKELNMRDVRAELMPQDKLQLIKDIQQDNGKVAMVGDGVNDAPALASATVGIAMGGAGTDTALETADIALMGDNLKLLPYTIRLSRKALRIIKQNIAFSLLIKLAALMLVIPDWLTLWIAILADMGATLLVTLNSIRLIKIEKNNIVD